MCVLGGGEALSPADVNAAQLHVVRSGVKAEERAERSEKLPE